jgi:PAS domain S-box-containing protein
MKDQDKTKEQPINELVEMRRRISELEKRPLERQILESKKRFQSIIDGFTDGIMLIDRECKIVAINKFIQQKVRQGFNKVLGKSCYEILNCALYGSDDCPAKKTFKTGKASNATHESLGKEGRKVYLDLHTFPLKDENGDINQVVVHARDITEKKRLEQESIRIEKLTSTAEIAAGVAHEVRNPLSIVSASAQYLQKTLGPGHLSQEYTEAIIKNAQTVETIISEFLNPKILGKEVF